MKRRNNRGFTLIELLATITILGIISVISIVAVSRLINKSKVEQKNSQEKTISMAAESYMQANHDMLPKVIGDTTVISVKTLKEANYLKENIKNSSGQSCMEYSEVVVYKKSATKYTYKTHLYCGDERPDKKDKRSKPSINVEFYALDADGSDIKCTNDSNCLTKVANPKYKIHIKGNAEGTLGIEGYNYSIVATVKKGNGTTKKEVYSSGTLNANREKSIVIPGDTSAGNVSGDLKDYIDITTATNITIYVSARNADGVAYNMSASILDEANDPSKSGTTYNDNVAPECDKTNSHEAVDENDWYNKKRPGTRKITVTCNDNGGSGCVRDKYTKTWPNSTEKQAEFSKITLKDNAGNPYDCTVRVNVDMASTVLTMKAYKKKNATQRNYEKEDSTNMLNLVGNPTATTANSAEDKVVINASNYNRLNNNWMNGGTYKFGVVYEITAEDNLALGSYEWKTNAGGIKDVNNASYNNLSSSNPDGVPETKFNVGAANCTATQCTIHVAFSVEGMRHGELIVKDIGGNITSYEIKANFDRTAPTGITLENKYENTWVNANKNTYTIKCTGSDTLSGINYWRYKYSGNYTNYGNSNKSPFTTTPFTAERAEYVYIGACDYAGNCSDPAKSMIKIDNTNPFQKPTMSGLSRTTASSSDYATYTSDTWLNKTRSYAYVQGSGALDALSQIKEYYYRTTGATNTSLTKSSNPSAAGVHISNENVTYVYMKACDYANNCSDETQFIVKIDRGNPTCDGRGGSQTWTNATKTSKEITQKCYDTVSGCNGTGTGNKEFKKTWTTSAKTGTIQISDKAGNTNTCDVDVYYDKDLPTCKKIKENDKWKDGRNSVTTKVQCQDTGGSECRVKDVIEKTYNKANVVKTDSYKFYDGAGNSVDCTYNVYHDKKIPDCDGRGGSTSWTKSDRTVTQKCNDNGGSGCDGSGTNGVNFSHKYTSTTKTDKIKISDKAGNTKECEVDVYVDQTKPKCKWSGDSTSWAKKRTIKLSPDDAHSGNDISTKKEWKYKTGTVVVKKLTHTVKDKVGNEKSCSEKINIYIDNDPPKIYSSGTGVVSWCSGGSIRQWFTIHDTGSGVNYRHIETNRGLNQTTYQGGQGGYGSSVDSYPYECMMASGSFTYTYKYCDMLDNCTGEITGSR